MTEEKVTNIFDAMPIERKLAFIKSRHAQAKDSEDPTYLDNYAQYIELWGPWMTRALHIATIALKDIGSSTAHRALKQIKELKA